MGGDPPDPLDVLNFLRATVETVAPPTTTCWNVDCHLCLAAYGGRGERISLDLKDHRQLWACQCHACHFPRRLQKKTSEKNRRVIFWHSGSCREGWLPLTSSRFWLTDWAAWSFVSLLALQVVRDLTVFSPSDHFLFCCSNCSSAVLVFVFCGASENRELVLHWSLLLFFS